MPSCGGPLRQIFRKVCFYEQKYDFGLVGVPFALLNHPPKLIKKQKFSKMIFFAVFLCHIEPTCLKLCFYNKNCEFWPLGPLLPFLKGPPNSSKTEIFKITISSVLPCHTEPRSTYQILCFYHQNYGF